jgi:predicted GTPase
MVHNRIEREFDAYSTWRQQVHEAIVGYRDWLSSQKLSDMHVEQRINQLLSTLNDDKLYIAFVAEFSRGKSELINAVFFGDMGQRVVPSGAGRTTMCPTELMYDPSLEPSIRLLPIETRSQETTISEFKTFPEEWEIIPLDASDPSSTAEALQQLSEVKLVTRQVSESLGLPVADDEAHQDGMHITEDGRVEIPRWRHAIVNYPHPLLEQGLVILDTPGLNALGAEPELTLNLLASAHAVIFILAADTGVTKSDMALWRDHIIIDAGVSKGQMVVLNKIDVLWDELRDAFEVEQEIDRQIESTSRTLSVDADRIFPISAQKALLGKIRSDSRVLANSRIGEFEDALTTLLIPSKREIVSANVHGEMAEVVKTTKALNEQRLSDVNEHIAELQRLNGKNMEVIEDMMDKVRSDKQHLEQNLQRFQATRSIFSKQTGNLYGYLSIQQLDRLIAETKKNMAISLTTGGLRTSMIKFFGEAGRAIDSAAKQSTEIQELMEGVYRKFQEEHGLANIKPRRFTTAKYQRELKRLIERHDHFIRGMSMVMTEQMVLSRRFNDSVVMKVKQIFERANQDADEWLRTIMSPMETQVREHQIQLRRRLESIKRIHKASDTLDDRLDELRHVRDGILDQKHHMLEHIDQIESILENQASDQEVAERLA